MSDRITLDHYILDTLMRDLVGHDRSPAAFITYLAVVSRSISGRVTISHRELAEVTGLSKRTVQNALVHLERRELLRTERKGRTDVSTLAPLAPWRRATTPVVSAD